MFATLKAKLTPNRVFLRPMNGALPLMLKFRTSLWRVWSKMENNPIHSLVEFFNYVSRFQDENKLKEAEKCLRAGKYPFGPAKEEFGELITKIAALQKHIKQAGRHEYGWNRTKPGEAVTLDNVYLGNVHGLSTHPARFWLGADDPYDAALYGESLTVREVIERQALNFMQSHVNPMLTLMNEIEDELHRLSL